MSGGGNLVMSLNMCTFAVLKHYFNSAKYSWYNNPFL